MRQRAALAAAVAPEPRLLIADEPTTALDVMTQAEVLDLIKACASPTRAVLLITHDLLVASRLCDRIAVAYAGRVVEEGPAEIMLSRPHHPYTQALLAAALKVAVRGRLKAIPGSPAAPGTIGGCPFHPRCPEAKSLCSKEMPEFKRKGKTLSACILT
jgi:oligopeptide/dipeptide ABC transporter ATP-binding protein